MPIFNVKDFGAVGNGVVDDTDAIQKTINASLGNSDPKTTVRGSQGPIYLPAGNYKITKPLKIYSAHYVNFHGDGGSTRLIPVGTLSCVLDVNGVAYSKFSDFLIEGNTTEQVENGIYIYWDPDAAYRSTTRVILENITIHGLRCVTGIRVGKYKSGLQCDQVSYNNLSIVGNWSPTETTWYQNGLYIGDGVFGNNLIHSATTIWSGFWKNGIVVDRTNYSQLGGSFGQNGTDIIGMTLGYLTIQGVRSETSQRLFESYGPDSNVGTYNFSDIIWSTDRLAADNEFIRMNANGNLKLTNIQLQNGGPNIKLVSKPYLGTTIHLEGISAQTPFDKFLDINKNVSVETRGYYYYNDAVGFVDYAPRDYKGK